MTSRTRTTALAGALLAGVLALTGCSSTGGAAAEETGSGAAGDDGGADRWTVQMVTHGAAGDTFWDLVRQGAEDAAAKDDIELNYTSDAQAANQANLVQNAIDADVDGIAVTLAKPDALVPVVRAAADAGIPVTALNGGLDDWQDAGAVGYFGQDEVIAGRAVGEKLDQEGATNAICVIHEQGNVGHEARCAGMAEAFSGTTTNLTVTGTDMPSVQATIQASLQSDPSIDYVVTLGAPFAPTAVLAAADAGSSARVGTFDTSADVVTGIQDGSIAWAIDQQPYLQGYLAVDALWLYLTNGNTIGGGEATLTGPAFVDATNVDAVADLAAAGTR